ncbi:hypothetical protein KI688_003030 [Linnemannia hyalina]|uniref:F-box domain-containing protein n=1 Tax=Linnemannia hyalina TaxID=64524 RepID=A0A9P7XS85_9FUNG|nr:hypothetical protein KI688_003030 [Linnemannia hyalina]
MGPHVFIPSDEPLDRREVALHFSRFLDKPTLLACLQVSRSWFAALEPCLWHSFTLLRDHPNPVSPHQPRQVIQQRQQDRSASLPRRYPTLGSLQRNARHITRLRYFGELPLLKALVPHLNQLRYLEATRYTDDVKQLLKQNAATLHTLILRGDPFIPGDTIMIDRIWHHLLDFTALRVLELNGAIVSDYEGTKFGLLCRKLASLSLIDSKLLERPKSEDEFLNIRTLVLDRSFLPKEDQPSLFEVCPALENFTWRSRSGKPSTFKFLDFLNAGRGEALSGLDLSGSQITDSDLASIIRLLPGLTRLRACNSLFGPESTRMITEMRQHQIQELILLQCPGFTQTYAQEVLRTCSRLRVFSAPAVNAVEMSQLRWSCTGLEELDISIAGTRRLPGRVTPRHRGIYSQLAVLTNLRVLRLGEVTDMEEGPFLLDLKVHSGLGLLSTLGKLEVFDCEKMKPVMEFFDLQWVVRNWESLKKLVGSVHPNYEQRDLSNEFLSSQLPFLETYLTQEECTLALVWK